MRSAVRSLSRRKLLGVTGGLALLPLVPNVVAATSTIQASPVATSSLSDVVELELDARSIPGAVVSVVQPGQEPWSQAFGVSDLKTAAPMTIHDHFRVGSITKTMTATVVLQLVDEGELALDDLLVEYHPEIPAAEQITIRQLLNMTSGLFDLLDDESFLPRVFEDPEKVWTTDELMEVSLAHPAEFAPGTRFGYSTTNYVLLGSIAESITGNTLAQEMQDRLFEPLGLSETWYPTTPVMPEPFAHGYAALPPAEDATPVPSAEAGYVDITEVHPSVYGAGGAVISTADDLRVWLDALLGGSLLSPSLQEERMTFPPVEQSGDTSYGLGVANYDGAIGHDGSALGYQAFAAFDQETGVSVISLANLKPAPDDSEPANEIAAAILNSMS